MGPLRNHSIKRRLAHALDLPAAVLLDQATIHLSGDSEARIINHKGLVQYTNASIKARSLQGMIEVLGNDLEIVAFSAHEIRILGRIQQVMLT